MYVSPKKQTVAPQKDISDAKITDLWEGNKHDQALYRIRYIKLTQDPTQHCLYNPRQTVRERRKSEVLISLSASKVARYLVLTWSIQYFHQLSGGGGGTWKNSIFSVLFLNSQWKYSAVWVNWKPYQAQRVKHADAWNRSCCCFALGLGVPTSINSVLHAGNAKSTDRDLLCAEQTFYHWVTMPP